MEHKYPQDALINTIQEENFSHKDLEKIRCELRSFIDTNEHDIKIAINLTRKKAADFFTDGLPTESTFDTHKTLETRYNDMHYYTTVLNRISKQLEKNNNTNTCSLSYTLFESDYIFKNVRGLQKIHQQNN